ncbi:MAG: GNAT family N-acetyltransferase [Bermanella sp.]
MTTDVVVANYENENHAKDIVLLLNDYAKDPMGGGEPLTQRVQASLVCELAKLPHAFSVIAYVGGEPAGLANCFMGFSTFKCKPLINIHDLSVVEQFRGQGISQALLAKVEEQAKIKGCCKVTLEVLEGNEAARHSYLKFGFDGYELDPKMGKALFWQKVL